MPAPATSAHREIPALAWSAAQLQRYGAGDERYASYPPASALSADFTAHEYQAALARSAAPGRSLALYLRLPFHRRRDPRRGPASALNASPPCIQHYLERLDQELTLVHRHLGKRREVTRLHWGGGTPALLSLDQLSELVDRLDARFGLTSHRARDYAIDIDPREATVFTLRHLQALGFNRLSLGVQELDPRVLGAIGRPQPRRQTEALLDEADRLGFRSLSIELQVGLPYQNCASFRTTLEQIMALAPPRLSLRHDTPLPPHAPAEALPSPAEQRAILHTAAALLDAAGYQHIGLGQFARTDDSLATAQRQGRLGYDALGYTHCPTDDLLGLGVSALSRIDDTVVQNATTATAYAAALACPQLPLARGARLTADDRIRGYAIERLLCDMALDLEALGQRFALDDSRDYFAASLQCLQTPQRDGLLQCHDSRLSVTLAGRLHAQHLARAFDAYAVPA